jgi:hypothetical protein
MNCDYCGKRTAFLEDLEYCSVCIDCLGEIDEESKEDLFKDLPIEKKGELD